MERPTIHGIGTANLCHGPEDQFAGHSIDAPARCNNAAGVKEQRTGGQTGGTGTCCRGRVIVKVANQCNGTAGYETVEFTYTHGRATSEMRAGRIYTAGLMGEAAKLLSCKSRWITYVLRPGNAQSGRVKSDGRVVI